MNMKPCMTLIGDEVSWRRITWGKTPPFWLDGAIEMLRLEKQWSPTYLSWLEYQQCDHTICEWPCVFMHLYTVCLHTTLVHPCVFLEDRIASAKCGWNMLLIWLSARISRTPSPRQPTPPTLSLGHLVRRRRGFVQDWGMGVEVCTGRVWDRLHNQPGTLLSNYSAMEEGAHVGCACLAICKCRVALSAEKDAEVQAKGGALVLDSYTLWWISSLACLDRLRLQRVWAFVPGGGGGALTGSWATNKLHM